jgi:MipA family protein
MKKSPLGNAVAVALTTVAIPVSALAQGASSTTDDFGLSGSIGGGVATMPEYVGAKKMRATPIPELTLQYKTRSLGTFDIGSRGIRWAPVANEQYTLGVLVAVGEGRDEKGSGLRRNKVIPRLKGLGKISVAPETGVFGTVKLAGFGIDATVLKGEKKGHNGIHADISIGYPFMVGDVGMTIGGVLKCADDKYMQAFFGVTPKQALNSKYRAFNAEAGMFSYGLSAAAQYPLTKAVVLRGFAGVDRLTGDAAKSPITEKKLQPTAGLVIAYNF